MQQVLVPTMPSHCTITTKRLLLAEYHEEEDPTQNSHQSAEECMKVPQVVSSDHGPCPWAEVVVSVHKHLSFAAIMGAFARLVI